MTSMNDAYINAVLADACYVDGLVPGRNGQVRQRRSIHMRRLIALALTVAPMLLFAGCERAKTKLDREVDRLCAIDGGMHVYETVKLPKEDFGPDGEVFPQYRGVANLRFCFHFGP